MPTDLISLIVNDAEQTATLIEAVRALSGASATSYSAISKHFGPAFVSSWRTITGKAEKLREKIAPERLTEPTPSVVIPLVDAACQENREALQDLWAALLANSMIDGGKKVRREFLDVVRKLEPDDITVLQIIRLPLPSDYQNHPNQMQPQFSFQTSNYREAGLTDDLWRVSLQSLTGLGCVTSVQGNSASFLTPLARMIFAACEVQ